MKSNTEHSNLIPLLRFNGRGEKARRQALTSLELYTQVCALKRWIPAKQELTTRDFCPVTVNVAEMPHAVVSAGSIRFMVPKILLTTASCSLELTLSGFDTSHSKQNNAKSVMFVKRLICSVSGSLFFFWCTYVSIGT